MEQPNNMVFINLNWMLSHFCMPVGINININYLLKLSFETWIPLDHVLLGQSYILITKLAKSSSGKEVEVRKDQ